MKTKLLYVIVSDNKDIYLEQGYVSMYSAKKQMPNCKITILTDSKTYDTFNGIRKTETKYADEIIVADLDPALPAKKRSRLLKTNARNFVSGDFLFIDCDTIVVKDLSEIDSETSEICACWDTHAEFKNNPYREMCINDVKKIGIDISNEDTYFNSGVIYVKDTEFTRSFYKQWNENYLKGYKKGVSMDQPSFEVTNIEMGYPLKKLADEWNCELKHGIRFLKDAYIVHYLCTNPGRSNDVQLFLLNEKEVFLKIKENGVIPSEVIEVIEDPFKGLARITHCFAGQDIYFFRSKTYASLSVRFLRQGDKMMVERIISLISKIKNNLSALKNKF